jgi:transposase
MRLTRTEEFRKDAVRIALTSGLTRKQVADDLGVGMSTLNKWITAHRDTDVVSEEDLGLAQENDRLRLTCAPKTPPDLCKVRPTKGRTNEGTTHRRTDNCDDQGTGSR